MRIIISVLLLSFLAACQLLPISQKEQYLTVLHTNDHHGRFWHNEDGEYGMAARKTLIDQLRHEATQQGHNVILLSGGDINTGVPESDLQIAEPDFKGMSLIGYDAMAIGNHEFDNPLSVLDQQIAWSNFPLLSANIIDKKTNQPAYQSYAIIQKGTLKIAVVGLTTTDTAKIANPQYIGHLDFVTPSVATKPLVDKIKSKYNPDVVIAVTHMGHYHNASHGINAPGDVTLARALKPNTLDMIIGGHSQEPICMDKQGNPDTKFKAGKACWPDKQNGIWIMQAHEWGKYVGKAVFKISNGDKALVSYELIPVNLKNEHGHFISEEIAKDEALYNFLLPYQEQGALKLAGSVGSVDQYLDGKRNTVRFEQSLLADLIINAQAEAVGADFGIISGGGIRASIKEGEVSYKDILKVHPFKNRVAYIDWRGQDLVQYLNVVASFPPDAGAYLQYHKIDFTINNGAVTVKTINNKPFDVNKTYRMSINSYNASGGDGYPVISNYKNYQSTDVTDAQALRIYIEKHSPVKVEQL
ncbi:bifunctional UDP-sugar hydrolase/5'-nucleotidase [Pseudoalteromonas luteoviolacea]|uniref:bifunctional UDP-sugar hydrolase/5'-nucleotidase UshA n=1 Tax=Pseudoalteromonas luteoviolacea TaxID=43657 RepID=UPI001B39CD31|nr:bifunctional UDP-sugar hydrolase/5'-nucleotidase UshA [Pseudoalteromonas luteoviolacea]MBQ4810719.1 bifunctional UDP-sugar hydrolase/5'-nucleotidase [Pseudoalteromonas luteoviolacea]